MRYLLTTMLIMSSFAFAEESTPTQSKEATPVEGIVKEAKKERRKKVQMCHDCGKPESECTCDGEEHKKK